MLARFGHLDVAFSPMVLGSKILQISKCIPKVLVKEMLKLKSLDQVKDLFFLRILGLNPL